MKKVLLFLALGLFFSLGNLSAETPDCGKAPAIDVKSVTAHSVTLEITPNNDNQKVFGLIYHIDGDYSSFRKDTCYGTIVTLTNLEADTRYYFDVRAICGEDNDSDRSYDFPFTTLKEEGTPAAPCSKAPRIDEFQNITHESAVIIIIPGVDTQTQWGLIYHNENDWSAGAFRKDTTTTTAYRLTNLEPNTTYAIDVRAICGAWDDSGRSIVRTFTTLEAPEKPEEQEGFRETNESTAPAVKTLRDGQLYLRYNEKEYNMQGAEMK